MVWGIYENYLFFQFMHILPYFHRHQTLSQIFKQNFDIKAQKQKIANKVEKLTHEIKKITEKLKNKSFLRNAPKQIVSREKNALINNKNELKKLNSILNSIKN